MEVELYGDLNKKLERKDRGRKVLIDIDRRDSGMKNKKVMSADQLARYETNDGLTEELMKSTPWRLPTWGKT